MSKRILRITCFFTLLMLTALVYVPAQQLSKLIQLPQKEIKGKEVIALIEKAEPVQFTFGKEVSARLEKALHFTHATPSVKEILELLHKTAGITYTISSNGAIVLKPAATPTNATGAASATPDAGRITGKVIDEATGAPVSDVSIRVKNTGAISHADGTFSLSLPAGKYEAEVSSVGYGAKLIADIEIKGGQSFEMNVTLTKDNSTLSGIIIRSTVAKESIAALYIRQKNEAGISNGISREQIAALPDKNVGETLKRISGVSTNDNRRVVVRGIAERYNIAMLDGAVLPSTDVQVRDFEFDIIPSNLIDNVIVSKTSTPDMSFGFGGGLVQVNTFAIPNGNFTTVSAGTKYIAGSTGKDFLGYGRGKYDYLGFDDGSRNHFPGELLTFDGKNYDPTKPNAVPSPGITPVTPAMIAEQNRKIGGLERMGTRTYKAAPGQNYQLSLGRNYALSNSRLGFVGSLSYRNEQSIDAIPHFERGNWQKIGNPEYDAATGEELQNTYGHQYNFNTTWGALFNMGWESKHHKITSRNFYSRVFNNQFTRTVGWGNEIGYGELPEIREYDRPKFITMLQNRINGEHTFGNFRFDWNIARNKLTNLEKDAVEAWLKPVNTHNGVIYNVVPSSVTNPGNGTFNRAQYLYEEVNKIAEASLSYQLNTGVQKQLVKAGYQFMEKQGLYDWIILPIGTVTNSNAYAQVPVQEWQSFLGFNDPLKDLLYYPAAFSRNSYKGSNTNQAVYGMLDNRLASWLRVVWGIRAEYYRYERLKNGTNDLAMDALIKQGDQLKYVDPVTGKIIPPFADPENEEKTWRYLPSASFTATPWKDVNIRAAYSRSVVRPSLIENSRMIRFDPAISAYRRNEGVLSTVIDHYDLRLEWYPKAGEVFTLGYFYKYFDKPVELYRNAIDAGFRVYVNTANSEWAKVHGWELDLRKNLGFIHSGWPLLQHIYLSGNLTLQSSTVQASGFEDKSMTEDKNGVRYEYRSKRMIKEKRPLYGQVPVLYNIGWQYEGKRFGANIAFNHMGYKTFATGMSPDVVEYERPRNQLDAQLSYSFLKNRKLNLRLNMSNLLNNPYRFYINSAATFQLQDKWQGLAASAITATDWDDIYEWKSGYSRRFEEGYYETSADGKTKTRIGDRETFVRKVGASFSLSVAYTF